MIIAIRRCWRCHFLSTLVIQVVKISEVIQALLFDSYTMGLVFTFFKHLVFAAFPITSSIRLVHTITVSLSLLRLHPLHSTPVNSSVFYGSNLKTSPASSALKMLSGEYSVMMLYKQTD